MKLALATVINALILPLPASAAPEAAKQLDIVRSLPAQPQATRSNEGELTSYLMVYFKDETHSLHFAVSSDGYSFTDVNNGMPVLRGADISEQKGIRDPHIVRGPDGAFYLSMTDLHIFALREGLRSTQWERPVESFGWGNNRSIIMMKSRDLVHWTHHIVHIDKIFPETAEIGAAWAPEAIFDQSRKKMMIYYTTRDGNKPNHMVYSYADEAFSTLTDAPKSLFEYPKPSVSAIDGDITKVGSQYHLFYVAHEKPGFLKQAISDRLNGGYKFDPTPVDPEKVGTEAPNLWKRYGKKTYVLMYDVFGTKPNNMGFSETEDFVYFRNIGRFNEPGSPMKSVNFSQPKHGAVIPISPKEADALIAHFNSTD